MLEWRLSLRHLSTLPLGLKPWTSGSQQSWVDFSKNQYSSNIIYEMLVNTVSGQ